MFSNISCSSSDSGSNGNLIGPTRSSKENKRTLPSVDEIVRPVIDSDNHQDDTTDPSQIDFGELSTDGFSLPDTTESTGKEKVES